MAITITAKLDASGVKTGAAQIENALDGMASEGVQATDKLDQAAAELQGEINDLKARAEALKAELSAMGASGANSLQQVENAAEEAADAVDGVGGSTAMEAVTAISTGYLALVDILGKVIETGKKVGEVVVKLAEDGNPGAVQLVDSFSKLKESLLELAEHPVLQNMFEDIADTINDSVIPAIKELPGVAFEMAASVQLTLTQFKESLKMVPEGTTKAMSMMIDVARSAMKTAEQVTQKNREERKRQEEVAKVDAELARIQQDKDAKAVESALQQIKTEEELRDIIDDLTESIRSEAHERKLSDDEREAALGKIRAAEDRLQQLREENADSEKKMKEDSVKLAEEAAKERQKVAEDELKAKEQAAKEALDVERRAIDERKRLLSGSDVNGAKAVLGAQSRDAVRDAYAQKKAGEAADQWANSGASQEKIAQQRKRALEMARRDFDSGKANSTEIRAVQEEMANKTINAAQQSGNVSKETARALREGIGEMAKVQNELEGVQQEIAYLKKLQEGVNDQGKRRRAQVAGAGR